MLPVGEGEGLLASSDFLLRGSWLCQALLPVLGGHGSSGAGSPVAFRTQQKLLFLWLPSPGAGREGSQA